MKKLDNIGILFAGQGSQKVSMGKDWYGESESFKKVFDLLPEKQRQIAFEGPIEELSKTENTQPIMAAFAAGVVDELRAAGVVPGMTAGLSLGEYSALYCAGVFDSQTLIDIVSLRGREMTKAAEGVQCAMYAVLGMDRDKLNECCEQARQVGIVNMVNFNCPGQIVISGEKAAVEKAQELAKENGAKRCMALPVSGPFHTEFMEPAGRALAECFAKADFHQMDVPVVFNAIGREKSEDESIEELLVKQVSSSVYFEDSIKYMEEHGIDTVIEVGPGKTLSGFVRKTAKNIKCLNIETYEDLLKVIEVLKGEHNEG